MVVIKIFLMIATVTIIHSYMIAIWGKKYVYDGMDGDLVVFSGDPLRLDSRVLAVYVKGVRVHDGSINDDN